MKDLHPEPLKYKETKEYYYVDVPVYERWEKVMKPQYCEHCGQEDGEYETTEGVNLLGYEKKKFKKDSDYYMAKALDKHIKPMLISSILGGPTLYERFKKSTKFMTGEKLNIPKLT